MKLKDKIVQTIKTDEIQDITTDIAEIILDSTLEDSLLKEVPILGTIIGIRKGYLSIQDRIFTKKLLVFLHQLKDIPQKDRISEIEKIEASNKYKISVGEKILYVIDQLDDHEKAELVGILFSSFLKKEISYEEFKRFADIVRKSSLDDLRIIVERNVTVLSSEESGDFISSGLFEIAPLNLELIKSYSNSWEKGENQTDYSLSSSDFKANLSFWGKGLIKILKNKWSTNIPN